MSNVSESAPTTPVSAWSPCVVPAAFLKALPSDMHGTLREVHKELYVLYRYYSNTLMWEVGGLIATMSLMALVALLWGEDLGLSSLPVWFQIVSSTAVCVAGMPLGRLATWLLHRKEVREAERFLHQIIWDGEDEDDYEVLCYIRRNKPAFEATVDKLFADLGEPPPTD